MRRTDLGSSGLPWQAASVLWIILLGLTAGCNRSGLNLAGVEGMVTYHGQPVVNAGVLFKPETGPFATGTTDGAGKFTLMTANYPGALVGEHRVAISKSQTTATQFPGERLPRYGTKYLVPAKYASPETSGLTATVSEDEDNNQFTFELTGTIGGA